MDLKKFSFINDSDFYTFDEQNAHYAILVKDIRTSAHNKQFYLPVVESSDVLRRTFPAEQATCVGRCGYDYSIILLKDGKPLRNALICFNCNRFLYEKQVIKIDRNSFYNFLLKNQFREIKTEVVHFDNVDAGRQFWEAKQKDQNIFSEWLELPDWIHYDGSFTMSAIYENNAFAEDGDIASQVEKMLSDKLDKVIEGRRFSLTVIAELNMGKETYFTFYIKALQKDYEKIKTTFDIGVWEEHTDFQLKIPQLEWN